MRKNNFFRLLLVVICLISKGCSRDSVKLNSLTEKSLIVLDSVGLKKDLSSLNESDISLFFWFSNNCCQKCVFKEIRNINTTNIDLDILYAFNPIRNWKKQRKFVINENNILHDFFCIYDYNSFVGKDNIPYYFVLNKEKNEICDIFYVSKNDKMKTFEYFEKLRKKYNFDIRVK